MPNRTVNARLACAIFVVAAFAASAGAQEVVWTADGVRQWDELGSSLTTVPDVDGDGIADVLVGAPGDFSAAGGRAYLYSGATLSVIREFDGDAIGDRFGWIVADMGDVDGDGVRDFAFAAPFRSVPNAPGGAIFVYSGTGAVLQTITSTAVNGGVGLSMTSVGDVDGDGVRDLLYGEWTGTAYKAVLVSGKTGARIRKHTYNTTFNFGFGLARAGDVDADGVDDYMVYDGDAVSPKLHVYSGKSGGQIFSRSAPVYSFAAAGDVDLDGHADLLVLTDSIHHVVSVLSGATAGVLYTVSVNNDGFGKKASATGDFDGDGYPDFVVASGTDALFGGGGYDGYNLFLFSGANGALIEKYFSGDDNLFYGPSSLDATADVDGDGSLDFVTGDYQVARLSGDTESSNGAIFVTSGADGSYREALGVGFQSELASSATLVDDVDHDGFRDVAVSLPGGADASAANLVEIRSGQDGHELSRFQPNAPFLRYFDQVVNVGDVDGDGTDDLAVGCTSNVEVRSGSDHSLLRTITTPSSVPTDLAAGADMDGTPLLAVATYASEAFVYDLTTGVLVTSYDEYPGDQIDCVGDVDGDGHVDWVTGELGNQIAVFSGDGSGRTIWSEDVGMFANIRTLANAGDFDGDGIDDVLASTFDLLDRTGRVSVLSGANGASILTVEDPFSQYDHDFDRAGSLGDVNGDGVPDFAITVPSYGAVLLYSGKTLRQLLEIDGVVPNGDGGTFPKRRLHTDVPIGHDKIPDLLLGFESVDDFRGRLQLFKLHPIFDGVDPSHPKSNYTATITTRGGPSSNLVGLYLLDLSGVPLDYFFTLGTFDANGEFAVTGTVPSSFAGETLTVVSYAIGFDGKLENSQELAVTFQ